MLNPIDTSKPNNRQMPIFQPMGLGGILDATLSLYRANLPLFLGIASLYFILMALQEGITVFLLEMSSTPSLDDFISDVESVLGTFVYMLIMGVSIVACSEIYLGRRITIQVALQSFRSYFWEYAGASLICLLLSEIWLLDSLGNSIQVSLLRIIFLPFLCFYLVSWVVYGPVVLLEESTAGQAIGRSKILVRGTWRRVCGIVLAILLFIFAIDYILGNSFGVILALFGIVGEGSLIETISDLLSLKYEEMRPTSLDALVMYLVYRGVGTFTLPIHAISITLLYFDLRIRKEGFDIEMQVRNSQTLDTKP